MPKYRYFSDKEEQEIIELYKTNTLRMTAIKFKTSTGLVEKTLAKYNIPKHTKEEDSQIKKQNHQQAWENKSEEELLLHNKRISEKVKYAWDTKSEEDRQAFCEMRKAVEQGKSESTKQEILEKQIATQKANWLNKSDEEKAQFSDKMKKVYAGFSKEKQLAMQMHRENTRRKNNTFSTSSNEEHFYNSLVQVYGRTDVIRQYKESRYPFNCDFYIKSEDLFIELNLSWTHGKKPFEGNSEDLATLNLWKTKAKTSDYYAGAIKTWTERDPLKLKIAKENNLKYLNIYTNTYFDYIKLLEEGIKINEYTK
jgi:hypothetical protein